MCSLTDSGRSPTDYVHRSGRRATNEDVRHEGNLCAPRDESRCVRNSCHEHVYGSDESRSPFSPLSDSGRKKCRLVFYASIITKLCHVRILSVVYSSRDNGIIFGFVAKTSTVRGNRSVNGGKLGIDKGKIEA